MPCFLWHDTCHSACIHIHLWTDNIFIRHTRSLVWISLNQLLRNNSFKIFDRFSSASDFLSAQSDRNRTSAMPPNLTGHPYPSIHPNLSSGNHTANCTSFQTLNNPINAVPFITWCAVILCQVFDLTAFHLWRQHKPPFMQFHVSLAVSSLLAAAVSLIAPVSRASPWTPVTMTIAKFEVGAFATVLRVTIVNTLFISVDRWLSVEFPHLYRVHVSPRKITIAVVVSWVVALVLTVPGVVIFHHGIRVACDQPSSFPYKIDGSDGDSMQIFFGFLSRGYYIIPMLFISQLRILMIAVETRLRLAQLRRQTVSPDGPGQAWKQSKRRLKIANLAVRIVWGNLLGSMTVVMGTVLANLPYNLAAEKTLVLIKMQNYLFTVQYLYTPLVYLVFFPHFRAAIKRPLLKGYDWGRRRLTCSLIQTWMMSLKVWFWRVWIEFDISFLFIGLLF